MTGTRMETQRAEFDAMAELAKQYRRLTMTPIVDNDYPEVRNDWETALTKFLEALRTNGRTLIRGATPGDGLTFGALRQANVERLPLFKGNAGQQAHSEADGSDWSLNDWIVAILGELGELANLAKKLRRGDFSLDDFVPEAISHKEGVVTYRDWMANEGGDIGIYLDIFLFQLRRDFGDVVRRKFNTTSAKIGVEVAL